MHTLDPDHLDYYRDFNDYLSAFHQFADKLPPDGYFFGNLDQNDIHPVFQKLQQKKFPVSNTFTYSALYESSDFYLKEKEVFTRVTSVGKLNMVILGRHNRINALAAFAVCALSGITPAKILKSLNEYSGSCRRFESKGHFGKAILIDDYGHHPTEIRATLQAAREKYPAKKICLVFQPHQYSRTKKLLNEFVTAFSDANTVIIPNIYASRDNAEDKASVSPESFVNELKKHHPSVLYGEGLENTAAYLKKNCRDYDLIITMGAGDVWKVVEWLKS
jgi:UDP-N-acetylmuramate--alanine ligase